MDTGLLEAAIHLRPAMAARRGQQPPAPPHKPITGSAETMAMHAMTIDPKTGLPKGEKPPASPAAVLSLICGILLVPGPAHRPDGHRGRPGGARSGAAASPHLIGGQGMASIGIGLGIVNVLLWTGIFVVYWLSQDA